MNAGARRRRASAASSAWCASASSLRPRSRLAEHLRRVALATCSRFPDMEADDQLLVRAAQDAGLDVVPAVWDDPSIAWDSFALTVVRNTWDYSDRRDAFVAWARAVPRLCNSAAVIEWNTDKRYLRALEQRGVPIVPTQWVESASDIASLMLPQGDVVVKPVVSAGSRNTERYPAGDDAAVRAHIEQVLALGKPVMVQPYLASVDTRGETALVFFDGTYSHAAAKGPILVQPNAAGDGLFAEEHITSRTPDPGERTVAQRALDALPWPPTSLLYARIDVVATESGPVVLEAELAEPSLFLAMDGGAAARFAASIVGRLSAAARASN